MANKYFDYTTYGTKGVYVTGLCAAPSMFAVVSFELASSPGATTTGGQLNSHLTLSRLVSNDSADLLTACIARTVANDLTVDVLTSYDSVRGVSKAPVLRCQAAKASVAQYSQYCVTDATKNNALELWEDASITCDSITLSALPAPSISAPPDQNAYLAHIVATAGWFVVTGLGTAPTAFERMAFEVAALPGAKSTSGALRHAPMTLSRRVGSGSPDLFKASATHGTLPKVVVFGMPPAPIKAGEATKPVPISTLINARLTRYAQYGAPGFGELSSQLWEEISVDFDQISCTIGQPPATSPGAPS